MLTDKDVSGPGRDHDSDSTNSRYEPSCIWLMARVNISSTNMAMGEEKFNESMRVEWAKTRARKLGRRAVDLAGRDVTGD